jgi:hypothetical protein
MIYHAHNLIRKYNLMDGSKNRVFIDGSSAGFIRSVKYQVGEYAHYERLIEKAKQDGRSNDLYHYMQIIPVSFNKYHRLMLANLKKYIDMGKVAIDPQEHENKELLTELRIATSDQDMSLEKNEINTMDLLDSLRLAMCMIK